MWMELDRTPRKILMCTLNCESLGGSFNSDTQRFSEQYMLLIKQIKKSNCDSSVSFNRHYFLQSGKCDPAAELNSGSGLRNKGLKGELTVCMRYSK